MLYMKVVKRINPRSYHKENFFYFKILYLYEIMIFTRLIIMSMGFSRKELVHSV